ncbi:ankyrin repeat-containing protein [Acanthamoeba polyphaga mimivirus]|uniref:Ankyrin repeat-containing protein n=1 Tax=Acanthamoeba polyphaga mimivirus Kroon TaxID=3069720 RepID=A0A0G2Y276_9VIRU|nr:ankyrin repeat-containing protein [Acanthamoeba polyphaga mimivirus]AKI79845.1 ankyrin repeat-containing protein [Acanthamoeba polyphaga mimivirus Kroon]
MNIIYDDLPVEIWIRIMKFMKDSAINLVLVNTDFFKLIYFKKNRFYELKEFGFKETQKKYLKQRITLIDYVVEKGYLDIIVYINNLKSNHNPLIMDNMKIIGNVSKDTALWYSCKNNNLDTIKYFIKKGANINNTSLPLRTACIEGHLDTVEYLFSCGIEITNNICDCFVSACCYGRLNIVTYLTNKISISLDYINEAFIMACKYGYLDVAKHLFNLNCDISIYALYGACINGHIEIVKYLISLGIDPRKEKCWAITSACQGGHLNIIKFLLSVGIKPKKINADAFSQACKTGNLEIAKYLKEIGANTITRRDLALELSARAGHLDVVKYIVGLGVNQKSLNRALIDATLFCRVKVVEYLVDSGSNFRQNNDYLFRSIICTRDYVEIAEYFIIKGVNIIVNNNEPIKTVCHNGCIGILKLLIMYGINCGLIKDQLINIAKSNNQSAIIKYLEDLDVLENNIIKN